MAKSSSVEQTLSRLHALRGQTALGEVRDELRKALGNRVNLIAAKAAAIVEEAELKDLAPEVVAAFERFMLKPAETDKGCMATTAAAKALYTMGIDSESVFLAGIRHVQMEGSYGKPTDTAAELRTVCAFGLVRMGYREVMPLLVDLLVDPEMQARIGAARAIAYSGRPEGELLLRLKILVGDREPDVLAECFVALLRLSAGRNLDFVARYLDNPSETMIEAAALALGESKHPRAFDILRTQWDKRQDDSLLLPLALTRRSEAMDLLITVIEQGRAAAAGKALEAMAMYRGDMAVRARVESAVGRRNDPKLVTSFRAIFS